MYVAGDTLLPEVRWLENPCILDCYCMCWTVSGWQSWDFSNAWYVLEISLQSRPFADSSHGAGACQQEHVQGRLILFLYHHLHL
jgi:hypothetical protein